MLPGRRRLVSPEAAEIPPDHYKTWPCRPQPTTCQCASLVVGAQDPRERPHPSPHPSRDLPFQCHPPHPPITLSRPPLAKAPHAPPARLSEAGTTPPPPSSSPAVSSSRVQQGGGTAEELTSSPEPCPGGSRPRLRPSFPEPRLPVRRQKPALLRREPPRRPSAPPPRRGLSSQEGGGRAPPDLAGERAREGSRCCRSGGGTSFEQLEIEGS